MERYLICYDVSDARRLQRIHRALVKLGAPLQYSVFCVEAEDRRIAALMDDLARLIDPQHDDLRAYRIPARGMAAHLGLTAMPDGIIWTGYPLPAVADPRLTTS